MEEPKSPEESEPSREVEIIFKEVQRRVAKEKAEKLTKKVTETLPENKEDLPFISRTYGEEPSEPVSSGHYGGPSMKINLIGKNKVGKRKKEKGKKPTPQNTTEKIETRITPDDTKEIYINKKLWRKIFSDGTRETYDLDGNLIGRLDSKGKEIPTDAPASTPEEKSKIEKETTPKTPEETEVAKEIENLLPKDKEKLGRGLSTIGFRVEKKKNDYFASVFDKIVKSKKVKEGGTIFRFCKELKDSFVRDSATAQKKAEGVISGKEKYKLSNVSLLLGNVVRYGRIISDATGFSLASPLRYVMMGGMAFTRVAEAGKEARLKNEEVIERTRIQDADLATKEAWNIYENAKKEAEDSNVSAEALKNAYLTNISQNLAKKLREPSIANGFLQKVLRFDMLNGVVSIDNKIYDIQVNQKLSESEKREKIKKITKKYEKTLKDYDRILTQYGIVDELAMIGRYGQTIGKTIVGAVTVETLVLSVEKLYEALSHVLSGSDAPELISASTPEPSGAQVATSEVVTTTPTSPEVTPPAPIVPPEIITEPPTPPETPALEPAVETPAPAVAETTETVNDDATIGKGEGIEHAFRRQIEHDGNLATRLGYKGDINDAKALHEFSGGAAHRVALDKGYVDRMTGQEIRVMDGDKIAYQIHTENGQIVVDEKTIDGKIIETRHEGDSFEKETEKYEYTHHGDKRIESVLKHPADITVQVQDKFEPIEPIRSNIREHLDLPPEPPTPEELKARIETTMDTEIENRTPLEQALVEPVYQDRVYEIYQTNIVHIFPEDTVTHWNSISNLKAKDLLNVKIDEKSTINPAVAYLHKLREITGLKPKKGWVWGLFGRGETVNEYVVRALQKGAEKGLLDQLKF